MPSVKNAPGDIGVPQAPGGFDASEALVRSRLPQTTCIRRCVAGSSEEEQRDTRAAVRMRSPSGWAAVFAATGRRQGRQ